MLTPATLQRMQGSVMETSLPTQSPGLYETPPGAFRGLIADAIRFWEVRRLIYNFVLFAVVVAWVASTWPHFRPMLVPDSASPSRYPRTACQRLLLRCVSCGRSDAMLRAWRHLEALAMDTVGGRNAPCDSAGELLDRGRDLPVCPLMPLHCAHPPVAFAW